MNDNNTLRIWRNSHFEVPALSGIALSGIPAVLVGSSYVIVSCLAQEIYLDCYRLCSIENPLHR